MKDAHDLVQEAKTMIHEVTLEESESAIQQADVLIDVREPGEYQQGHLPAAINIPRGVLEFKVTGTPELANRDLKFVVYCKTSGRAALAAKALQDMGYLNVTSISGGFDAWLQADKPVVKPDTLDFE